MPAINHSSYTEEYKRCNETIEYVEKALETATSKKSRIDSSIDNTKKHFNSENSQNYIDLMINTSLQDNLTVKLRNLITARNKPYFARIDFREMEKNIPEKLYIGKMCLMSEVDQSVIIVDWRAPISNLYYEGRLGECSYPCPEGILTGELSLKRQFSINDKILEEIFDIDITTNDEFLQTYLGASADNRLKEIVSTIQEEQNKIVRADMWKPLIVQGVAGSGKTTIALHRIAYLIYTFEKTFTPENFMIIAPNKLFLNYISEVLPELGVEKVKQTTFEDFSMELLAKKFKLSEQNEKLNSFVNNNSTPLQIETNTKLKQTSQLKGSILFKNILDIYLKTVENSFIPKEDFKIGSKVVFGYAEINRLFLNEYGMWPIAKRVNEIKKHLSNRLKLRKDSIINKLHDDCDEKIANLKEFMVESDERQALIIKAIDEKTDIISNLESYAKKAVNLYIKKISKLSPFDYYKDFINDKEIFLRSIANKVDPALGEFLRQYTSDIIKSGYLEIEDLAPIIYLKYCIYGIDEKIPVKHIVIDEAQDFSVFQLYVIRKIIKDSSFTILGDLCQGIHSYRGIQDWEDLSENVFADGKCKFLTLEQSYRTTVEIMTAASKVISRIKELQFLAAKPVIRHGEEVKIISKDSITAISQEISQKIITFKEEGIKSIAIICKTQNECKLFHTHLKKSLDEIYVLTGKEDVYKSGLVIVPSYLAKGLEFDIVFISNASREEYMDNDLDTKLLYVSMTRALHKLHIYHCGEVTHLLEGV